MLLTVPMTSEKEKIFDDIARVAGGTVSVLSGLSQEIREEIRARFDEMAFKMDLVPREDFERLEIMLAETRKEQKAQNKRLEELEKQLKKTKKK